jgi:hypothetical protein
VYREPPVPPDPSIIKAARQGLRIAADRVRDLEQRLEWHAVRGSGGTFYAKVGREELVDRLVVDLHRARDTEQAVVERYNRLATTRPARRVVAS